MQNSAQSGNSEPASKCSCASVISTRRALSVAPAFFVLPSGSSASRDDGLGGDDGALGPVAQITLDALGALPASHAIASADTFSVKEVMEVLEAMGIDMMGTKADSSGAASIVTFLVQSRVDTVLRKSGADAQSWPASSAVALGQALVRFNATGVAVVAEFPLTVAFELLALDTSVWDAFLTESISVTAAGDDALSAGRRVVAARSEYVRRALLNKYLEEIGAGEATIAAGTGSLSTGQLHVRLMELAPKEQALTATSASMHMAHGGVLSVNLMQPDLSGSEHERRERIRLRFDADAVQSDASLVHSNRTRLVTSLVTRVNSCNALQGCYKGHYKGRTLVMLERSPAL